MARTGCSYDTSRSASFRVLLTKSVQEWSLLRVVQPKRRVALQLPSALRRRVLPARESVPHRRPGFPLPERRHVQRGDECHKRTQVLVYMSRGLHGHHVRDQGAQRLRHAALPQRGHVPAADAAKLHMLVRQRLSRQVLRQGGPLRLPAVSKLRQLSIQGRFVFVHLCAGVQRSLVRG